VSRNQPASCENPESSCAILAASATGHRKRPTCPLCTTHDRCHKRSCNRAELPAPRRSAKPPAHNSARPPRIDSSNYAERPESHTRPKPRSSRSARPTHTVRNTVTRPSAPDTRPRNPQRRSAPRPRKRPDMRVSRRAVHTTHRALSPCAHRTPEKAPLKATRANQLRDSMRHATSSTRPGA